MKHKEYKYHQKDEQLEKRILDISYRHKLSHIGSCLTAVHIIDYIYKIMGPEDVFVLSSGHAGLALYVVLEKRRGLDAEKLFKKHGVHPTRDLDDLIYCSSGSLGHGFSIALGFATRRKSGWVYCLSSDGELAEGSISEAAHFIGENKKHLRLSWYVNNNGYAAYRKTNNQIINSILESTEYYIRPFNIRTKTPLKLRPISGLQGQSAHYYTLTDEDYSLIQEAYGNK
jgi:transketolase